VAPNARARPEVADTKGEYSLLLALTKGEYSLLLLALTEIISFRCL
jgi:hypothetical protein